MLYLDLTAAQWAAEGLLAVFFLAVGLELKHELVAGSLRDPREAGVPALAALGGMLVPAAVFVAVEMLVDRGRGLGGWAIPTATDIAFALAVLAVFGRGLPAAIRTFLLTLAVVDDLLAIVVIAVLYSSGLHLPALLGAAAALAATAGVLRWRRPRWWLVVPLALAAWSLLHASGVHSTITGVVVGLSVPARPVHGERRSRAQRWAEKVAPWSQGLALPVFAFFAAGVNLVDGRASVVQPVVLAIVVALVGGKPLGVLGTAALVTRFSPLRLAPGLTVRDLLPVGLLAGIGFTVALLVSELSFGPTLPLTEGARLAVLLASALAAVLGGAALRRDARRRRGTLTRRRRWRSPGRA